MSNIMQEINCFAEAIEQRSKAEAFCRPMLSENTFREMAVLAPRLYGKSTLVMKQSICHARRPEQPERGITIATNNQERPIAKEIRKHVGRKLAADMSLSHYQDELNKQARSIQIYRPEPAAFWKFASSSLLNKYDKPIVSVIP